jgi:ribonuclease HI
MTFIKPTFETVSKIVETKKINFTKDMIHVYTDGSFDPSMKRAAMGIYFPNNESHNESLRIAGEQCIYRAELTAISRAIDKMDPKQSFIIFTDSESSMKAIESLANTKASLLHKNEI